MLYVDMPKLRYHVIAPAVPVLMGAAAAVDLHAVVRCFYSCCWCFCRRCCRSGCVIIADTVVMVSIAANVFVRCYVRGLMAQGLNPP